MTQDAMAPGTGEVAGRDASSDDQTLAGQLGPTVARGGNVVVARPPAAPYLAPTIEALADRAATDGPALLILCGEAMVDPVADVVAGPWHAAGGTLLSAWQDRAGGGPQAAGLPGALVTTPAVARALLAQAALPLSRLSTLLMAWPECWEDEAPLVDLMQDLPAETQRILYSADPDRIASLSERYLRKALVVGFPATEQAAVATPVEVVVTAADRIAATTRELVTGAGPGNETLTVWAATAATEASVRDALRGIPMSVDIIREDPPQGGTVIAADLPAPEALARLAGLAARLVLVSPPTGLPYLTSRISAVTPAGDRNRPAALSALERQRTAVEKALQGDPADLDRAVYALAPLFERHEPARVAAALFRLWSARAEAEPQRRPAEPARPAGGTRKVFVTAGKKDRAGPADFMALLTRELEVPRTDIGKIDVRETFTLIELPTASAEEIARRMNGRSLRRRTIAARLERPRPEGRKR